MTPYESDGHTAGKLQLRITEFRLTHALTFCGEQGWYAWLTFPSVAKHQHVNLLPTVDALHRAHGFVVHTLQIRIRVGEDPLPDSADLVLIDAREEALSADAWADVVRPLVHVRAHFFVLLEI